MFLWSTPSSVWSPLENLLSVVSLVAATSSDDDKMVLLLLLQESCCPDDIGWPLLGCPFKETSKLPNALPVVSGKYFTKHDVIILTENMTIPMVRSEVSLDTINGQVIPPTRPSALADDANQIKSRNNNGSNEIKRQENCKNNQVSLYLNTLYSIVWSIKLQTRKGLLPKR